MQRKFVRAWINTCSTIVVLLGGRVFTPHPSLSWTSRQSPMFWPQTTIPHFLLSLSRNHKMHALLQILSDFLSLKFGFLFQYRYFMSTNLSCFSFMISLNKPFKKAPSWVSACLPFDDTLTADLCVTHNSAIYHSHCFPPSYYWNLEQLWTCSILCIEGTCLLF